MDISRINRAIRKVESYKAKYSAVDNRTHKSAFSLFQKLGDLILKIHYRRLRVYHLKNLRTALLSLPMEKVKAAMKKVANARAPGAKAAALAELKKMIGSLQIVKTDVQMQDVAAGVFARLQEPIRTTDGLLEMVIFRIDAARAQVSDAKNTLLQSVRSIKEKLKSEIVSGNYADAFSGTGELVDFRNSLAKGQDELVAALDSAIDEVIDAAEARVKELDASKKALKEEIASAAKVKWRATMVETSRRIRAFRVAGPIAPFIPSDSPLRFIEEADLQQMGLVEATKELADKLDKRGTATALLQDIPDDLCSGSLRPDRRDQYQTLILRIPNLRTAKDIQIFLTDVFREMNIGKWEGVENIHENFWGRQWLVNIVSAYRLMAAVEKEVQDKSYAPQAGLILRQLAADAKAYRLAYGNLQGSNGSVNNVALSNAEVQRLDGEARDADQLRLKLKQTKRSLN